MAKYFTDEKSIPFKKLEATPENITNGIIGDAFERDDMLSICIKFNGFHENSIGYIANVVRVDKVFEIYNITGEREITAANEESLAEILLHICGHTYSERAQEAFQKIRNDIGSNNGATIFDSKKQHIDN